MKVVIAGGGIGGLTAALALRARGHDVTVLEAVREPKPLGVGINLLPHAVGVLDDLGLLPALRGMAVETSALVFANRHGQAIYRDARGLDGGYSHPQFSIHRGELQMMLWCEASARCTVLGGQRVVGVRDGNVALIETAGGPRELAADLIVGADGIHSALRKRLAADEGAPCWRGVMMWRGTSWAPPFLDGRTMVQAGHSQAKFVVYPIGAPRDGDGLQLINWIADRRVRVLLGTARARCPGLRHVLGPEDLDGKNLCSVTGSTSAQRIKDDYAAGTNLLEQPGYSECVTALTAGTVDAVTTDDIILAGLAAIPANEGKVKVVGNPFSEENYGVGLPKDSDKCQAVTDAINEMLEDGSWQKALDDNVSASGYEPNADLNPPTPAACE